MSIKLGCCLGISKKDGNVTVNGLDIIKNAGFDYMELPGLSIAQLSDEEFGLLVNHIHEKDFDCLCMNIFFAGDMKLTGDHVDYEKIDTYCEHLFNRMKVMGTKTLVFGSGVARSVPEGFSKEKAFDQLVFLLKRISAPAKNYGITIVIEPLWYSETNIINTVIEGIKLVNAVDSPNIQLLADYYHIVKNNEDLNEIVKHKENNVALLHAHIANPEGRTYPTSDEDYSKFFNMLKDFNFSGNISIEGSAKDLSVDAVAAFIMLKESVR